MKKIICFISVIIISFSFTGLDINAQDGEFTINADNSQEYFIRAKEILYSEMDNLCDEVTIIFTGKGLDDFTYDLLLKEKIGLEGELITEYMQTAGKDYNALILRGYSISKTVWKNSLSNEKATKLRIVYSFRWDETAEDIQRLDDFSESVIQKLSIENKTPYETVKAIHDFVVSVYSYDTSPVNEIHNPSEMIETKTGVCSAYTRLVYKLLTKAGIESRIVLLDATGKSNGVEECHTWNLVKLNNSWYHMDTTWDDPITAFDTNKIQYDYFLKSDETFLKDHSFTKTPYPAAPEDYKESNLSLPIINIVPEKDDTLKTESVNEIKTKRQTSLNNSLLLLFFSPSAFICSFFVILLTIIFLSLIKSFEK